MTIKQSINNIFRSLGFQISQYPDMDLRRRMRIIQNLEIDLILDVGANAGQYGQLTRQLGYSNQIISFEPIKQVFDRLHEVAKNDSRWQVFNYALGDKSQTTQINVSKNTVSSSILPISNTHTDAAPNAVFVEKETIEVKTLNDIFPSFIKGYKNPFLKLDVQGFEKNVLDGASEILKQLKGIQLELSLVPLYKNETTLLDMLIYMNGKGFDLVSLENSLIDNQSSFLLQADGIFLNRNI